MDEQAGPVEHLSELRQGVRTDRGRELPRSLPIDDHLAGLETAPEKIERCVLQDDGPVVARLPALRRHPPHEAVAIEQFHQELATRPKGSSDPPQNFAILRLPIKKPERGEHRDRRVEGASESQATHVPLDEGGLDTDAARGFPCLRQKRRREVESGDAVPALREADRVAAGTAPEVEDAPAFPEVQDLVDRLDLGRRLRMDVSDQVVGPEEVLVPSLRDLRHRPPRTACAGKILPRSLLLDPRTGFPLDSEAEMLEVRDHRVFAAGLEELDDGLDLRPHAARRELPLREVLPRFGGREPVEEPLARLAEVEGYPRDVRRDHEVLPPDRPREHRGGEILVNHRLDADELAVPPDDRDASAARRDNDPSVALAHAPPEDVFLDDVNGPRGGHDAAPAAPFVVHHLPAFRLLDDDLVFPRIVGADRFRRVRESGVLRVDEHLGHDADDIALDLAGRELVAQRLRQDVAYLRLALRAADV